jgi:hypothetical protein
MKRVILVFLIAIACGILAFFAMRAQQITSNSGILLDQLPELNWLETELQLTRVEFEKVKNLHLAYRPRCVELCHRIHTAHRTMAVLARKDESMNPDLAAAITEHSRVAAECQKAMLEHVYQTASILSPEKAKIYLQRVLPYALHEMPELHGSP